MLGLAYMHKWTALVGDLSIFNLLEYRRVRNSDFLNGIIKGNKGFSIFEMFYIRFCICITIT